MIQSRGISSLRVWLAQFLSLTWLWAYTQSRHTVIVSRAHGPRLERIQERSILQQWPTTLNNDTTSNTTVDRFKLHKLQASNCGT
jgi:hypothetical protein